MLAHRLQSSTGSGILNGSRELLSCGRKHGKDIKGTEYGYCSAVEAGG